MCLSRVAAAQSSGHNYVGAQRCAQCHAFAYKVWLGSAHSRAHLALDATQQTDGRCTTCHQPSAVAGEKVAGVQCEACHGPGRYYQPRYVMRDRELSRLVGLLDSGPGQCQTCHTAGVPSIKPFDFGALWAQIDHSKAAEQQAERPSKPNSRGRPSR